MDSRRVDPVLHQVEILACSSLKNFSDVCNFFKYHCWGIVLDFSRMAMEIRFSALHKIDYQRVGGAEKREAMIQRLLAGLPSLASNYKNGLMPLEHDVAQLNGRDLTYAHP